MIHERTWMSPWSAVIPCQAMLHDQVKHFCFLRDE